jgi:hypothetical protein
VRRLLVAANVVPSTPILVTLMMETLDSFEALVFTRATQQNVPEDDILQVVLKYVKFQVFGNDSNKSNFDSGL